MKRKQFLISYMFVLAMFSVAAKAQSIVDPGISVYNYKHPNKAAQAKKNGKEMTIIRVENYNTVELYGKHQRSRYASTTPKYAPRPARLVVARQSRVEGMNINPLTSPWNYKTPQISLPRDTSGLADSQRKPEYPTVD